MLPILQLGPLALPIYPISLLLAFWAGLALSARSRAPSGRGRRSHVERGIVRSAGDDHSRTAGARDRVLARLSLAAARDRWAECPGVSVGTGSPGGLDRRRVVHPPAQAALGHRARRSRAGALAGLIIANLGALLAGNGVGAPANLPWAVDLWGVSRHPVQLYAALGELITLAVVLHALRKPSRPGTAALLGLLGWGLTAWLIEPFRAGEALSSWPASGYGR